MTPGFCSPLGSWTSNGSLTSPGPVTDPILTLTTSGTRAPEKWVFSNTLAAVGGTLTVAVGGVTQTTLTHAAGTQTTVLVPPGGTLSFTPTGVIPAARWLASREPWPGEQLY